MLYLYLLVLVIVYGQIGQIVYKNIVSIITCSCCRFQSSWSNCEWGFYDPIHTIKKHAL